MATNTSFNNVTSMCLNNSNINDDIFRCISFNDLDTNPSPPATIIPDLLLPLNTVRLIVSLAVGIPGLLMNVVNIIVWTTPTMRRTPRYE